MLSAWFHTSACHHDRSGYDGCLNADKVESGIMINFGILSWETHRKVTSEWKSPHVPDPIMRSEPSLLIDPRKNGGPGECGHLAGHHGGGKGSSMNQTARHSSNEDNNMERDSRKIHRDDRMIGNIEQMKSWRRQGEEGGRQGNQERDWTEDSCGGEKRERESRPGRCAAVTLPLKAEA